MFAPQYITRYSAPSGSSGSSRSVTYDHSGLDDRIKRLEMLGAAGDAKYKSLYEGDIAGSVTADRAESRIRDLLSALRNVPLSKVASTSNRSDQSFSGADISGHHGEVAQGDAAESEPIDLSGVTVAPRRRIEGIAAPPERKRMPSPGVLEKGEKRVIV